jgi:Holliday junction resolvasome RuvABC ATP-dependent DNA helicase subunit
VGTKVNLQPGRVAAQQLHQDITEAQAVAAVARITRANFRLIDRLFTQVERVVKINELSTITDDVIEAARSTLVVGIS